MIKLFLKPKNGNKLLVYIFAYLKLRKLQKQ